MLWDAAGRWPRARTQFESQRVGRLTGRSARCCARVLVAPETGQLELDLVERHAADDIVAAVGCQESVRRSVEFKYLERARIGVEKPHVSDPFTSVKGQLARLV